LIFKEFVKLASTFYVIPGERHLKLPLGNKTEPFINLIDKLQMLKKLDSNE